MSSRRRAPFDFGGLFVTEQMLAENLDGLRMAEETREAKQALARRRDSVQLPDQVSEEERTLALAIQESIIEEQRKQAEEQRKQVEEQRKQAEDHRKHSKPVAYPCELGCVYHDAHPALSMPQGPSKSQTQPGPSKRQITPALSVRPALDGVASALRDAYQMGLQTGKEEGARDATPSPIADAHARGFAAGEAHGKQLAAVAFELVVQRAESELDQLRATIEAMKREVELLKSSRG